MFLFAYLIVFFLIAFPFFALEIILGQFASAGPIGVFQNLSPAFTGVGWAMFYVRSAIRIYYTAMTTWALF